MAPNETKSSQHEERTVHTEEERDWIKEHTHMNKLNKNINGFDNIVDTRKVIIQHTR